MKVRRCRENPIIGPKDIKPSRAGFEVVGVFNTAVARLGDEVLLLLRVAERPVGGDANTVSAAIYDTVKGSLVLKEFSRNDGNNDFSDPRLIISGGRTYLSSISHLRLARSKDGVHFEIDAEPALAGSNEYEAFGLEDARISFLSGTYYITFVAVSPKGVTTCLASTGDFEHFERLGVIFCPENKDVAIFPHKINGKYYALHRPVSPLFANSDIWLAESDDLICWGNHRYIMGPRAGKWDELKVGAGAVPFETEQGWLEIYHGADRANRYCLGAVLLDAEKPWEIIARSAEPVLEPQADYETRGFFGNVVFTCGVLFEDNILKIYYGVADTAVCYAEIELRDVIAALAE